MRQKVGRGIVLRRFHRGRGKRCWLHRCIVGRWWELKGASFVTRSSARGFYTTKDVRQIRGPWQKTATHTCISHTPLRRKQLFNSQTFAALRFHTFILPVLSSFVERAGRADSPRRLLRNRFPAVNLHFVSVLGWIVLSWRDVVCNCDCDCDRGFHSGAHRVAPPPGAHRVTASPSRLRCENACIGVAKAIRSRRLMKTAPSGYINTPGKNQGQANLGNLFASEC